MIFQKQVLHSADKALLNKLSANFHKGSGGAGSDISYHRKLNADAMAQIVVDLLSEYEEGRVNAALSVYAPLATRMITLEESFPDTSFRIPSDFRFIDSTDATPEEHQGYAHIHTLLNNIAHDLTADVDSPFGFKLEKDTPAAHLLYALSYLSPSDALAVMQRLPDLTDPDTSTLAGIREEGVPSIRLLDKILAYPEEWQKMGDKRWQFADFLKDVPYANKWVELEGQIIHLMNTVAENPEYGLKMVGFISSYEGKLNLNRFLGNSQESLWMGILMQADEMRATVRKWLP